MDLHKFDTTLRLIPVEKETLTSNEMIDPSIDQSNERSDVQQSPIQNSSNRSFQLTAINLKSSAQGDFFLKDEDDKWIKLQSEDYLYLAETPFLVEIIRQQIIENPDPSVTHSDFLEPSHGDIWNPNPIAMPQSLHQSNTVDSFAMPLVPQQERREDPLSFLYPSHDHSSTFHNDLIPHSSGRSTLHYDPIPTLSSPMPAISVANEMNDLSLNFNETSGIGMPQSISMEAERDDRRPNYCATGMDEGNVLRDLGIDSTASVLPDLNPNEVTRTYNEQSPMDMLDEYLQEDPFEGNAPQSYLNHPPPSSYQSAPPSYQGNANHLPLPYQERRSDQSSGGIFESLKNFKNRLLG